MGTKHDRPYDRYAGTVYGQTGGEQEAWVRETRENVWKKSKVDEEMRRAVNEKRAWKYSRGSE